MCLRLDLEETEKLKKLHDPAEAVTVWKELNLTRFKGRKMFVGWDFKHPENQWIYEFVPEHVKLTSECYTEFKWSPGVNVSGRQSVELTYDEIVTKEVDRGFHVYKNDRTDWNRYRLTVIVPFTAYWRHFVAIDAAWSEMVFTSLFLDPEIYKKVTA